MTVVTKVSVVDDLRARAAAGDPTDAVAVAAQAQTLINELEAIRFSSIATIEKSRVWQVQPRATVKSWLRSEMNLDRKQVSSDLRAARTLEVMPQLKAAAHRGEVRRDALNVIASIGRSTAERARVLSEFDEPFTMLAVSQPPSSIARALRPWAEQVDPQAVAKDEHAAHDRRFLFLTQLADGWSVNGFLDKEQGMKFAAALNAAATRLWRQADSAPGMVAEQKDDEFEAPRINSQQRADAFIEGIIEPALAAGGLPATGGVCPTVTLVVPLERVEAACNQPASPKIAEAIRCTRDGEIPFMNASAILANSTGPGETVVSIETAQRILCDCNVHRIVLNDAGVPIEHGRTKRTFTPEQRRLLTLRDKGCIHPGCERPAPWCEAHHVTSWLDGGNTDISNGVLLCSAHHHDVHRYQDTITFDEHGKPKYTRNLKRKTSYWLTV